MPQGPVLESLLTVSWVYDTVGLSPFCPALTDVLISQAERAGPLGINFWGPTGRSFSGTKRETWSRSCSFNVAMGTLPGALGSPGLQSDLDNRVGL